MPPKTSLVGILQMFSSAVEVRTGVVTTLRGGGMLARDSVAAMMANLLPQATPGLANASQGVYVREGLLPARTSEDNGEDSLIWASCCLSSGHPLERMIHRPYLRPRQGGPGRCKTS